MIKVEKLAKSYGEVQAIKDVSFTAADGKITTLLGANGSGKTTTFNSIFGLSRPDAGLVEVDGINVLARPLETQARMGVFPDKFGLYTRLTTREHLEYFGGLHSMGGAELSAAIDEVVALFGIEDIIDRRTEGFSQGQRMKVALARAILHKPQNLVLDEPSRGLDVMSIRLLRRILLAMRERGQAILLSSHVMAEVEALSDHIVVIADGLVKAEGTSREIIALSGQKTLEDAFVVLAGHSDEGTVLASKDEEVA